jgi:hypothetical protein
MARRLLVLLPLPPPRESSRYRDDDHYGVIHLTLAPTAWRSEFHRTDGQVADRAVAGCWR